QPPTSRATRRIGRREPCHATSRCGCTAIRARSTSGLAAIDPAIERPRRNTMTSRRDAEQMLAAAVAELRAGRLLDAERIARSVCDQAPNEARAFHLAGVLAHQLKRSDGAALLGRAVAIDPRLAEAHNDRGVILAAGGALAEALSSFERAVEL